MAEAAVAQMLHLPTNLCDALQITSELLDRVVDEILGQIPEVCKSSLFTLDWWASGCL